MIPPNSKNYSRDNKRRIRNKETGNIQKIKHRIKHFRVKNNRKMYKKYITKF